VTFHRNKYFQFTQEKKYWMKIVFLSQYLFIAILCVKISRVNKALEEQTFTKNIVLPLIQCTLNE